MALVPVLTVSMIINIFSPVIHGDVVLQNERSCGSQMEPMIERVIETGDFQVNSHNLDYYAPYMDCVVTIIGEKYHQWIIELINIDIDGHSDRCKKGKPCCNDYLKIFNAYTVDNARLFQSIPWRGLCGNRLPRRKTFTSTQNYVTIQFNSDILAESKRGFHLTMRQQKRRSAGNDFYESGFVGGWNDGTLNELQVDWAGQEAIPGDYVPGRNPTFEYDPNGVDCYVCTNCKKDYFKTSTIGVTVKKGCYICTKEWRKGTATANRECLSRSGFQERLQTMTDTSGGTLRVNEFRSCKTLARGVIGANFYTLCACDTNKCNSGTVIAPGLFLLVGVFMTSVLAYLR